MEEKLKALSTEDGVYTIEEYRIGGRYRIRILKNRSEVYSIFEYAEKTYSELRQFMENFIAFDNVPKTGESGR